MITDETGWNWGTKSEEARTAKGNLQKKTFEQFFDGKLAGMDEAAFNLASCII